MSEVLRRTAERLPRVKKAAQYLGRTASRLMTGREGADRLSDVWTSFRVLRFRRWAIGPVGTSHYHPDDTGDAADFHTAVGPVMDLLFSERDATPVDVPVAASPDSHLTDIHKALPQDTGTL